MDDPIVGVVDAETYRAAGYGPNAGDPPTHDTTYGPNENLLGENDIAVSPNMLGEYPLGSSVDIVDPRSGRVIYPNQHVADYSYTSPGHPNYNEFEQRHVKDMGHMGLRPHVDTPDNNPVVGRVDGLSDTPEGAIQQPDNNPVVGLVDLDKRKPKFAGVSKEEVQTAEEPGPIFSEGGPLDVGKFLQTFVGSGVQQLLTTEKGAAEAQQQPEKRQVLPYEEQVQQAKENAILNNPDTSQEEADDIIHQRNQRLAYVKANAQQNLEESTGALSEAQKNVDQKYEATPQGQVAKTLGTGAANIIPALTGPAAPLTLAESMGAQTYDEEKDRATASAKKAHPEWTDDQIEAASTQAAENASRTSAESGVILSLLPVPKIGPLLARVIERVGMRGAYMALAGAVQDISANKELQNIDPRQALYDGVLARMPTNFIAGGAFELPGAIGEATGRPKAAAPEAQETPEAQPRVETPVEPQQIVTGKAKTSQILGPEVSGEEYPGDVINVTPPELTPEEHNRIANLSNVPDRNLAERMSLWQSERQYRYPKEIDVAKKEYERARGYRPLNIPESIVPDRGSVGLNGALSEWEREMPERGGEQPPKPPASLPEPTAEQPKPVAETDQWVSSIANRYSQERSSQGEIGEIAPGQGYSTTDLLNKGLRMSPEEINQHVSDLMHDTGDPKLQAAAIRAEEVRLSQRSSQLSRVAEQNPDNPQARIDAENAFKDLTDFHNGPVAKLKNNWHAQGMTLQGEVPVDLSTFNGLREAWLRDVGTRPPKSVEMTMRNTATRVRAAVEVENAAMNRLGREVDRAPARGLSAEDVEGNIIARMKDLPCRT